MAEQTPLFDTDGAPSPVAAADWPTEVQALADHLHRRHGGRLHLGTSSWHFPGWQGLVWAGRHDPLTLSRHGLNAYARHPLLRCVSLDRTFYRPLEAAGYALLAAQVDPDFRFVVKAPALVADAVRRDPDTGAALGANTLFLDPATALNQALRPAVAGLKQQLGVLVFQLSPLPGTWRNDMTVLMRQLQALWDALLPELPTQARLALEVRDPGLLTRALAAQLKTNGVRYCLGLHDRMPSAREQLPMLRATWPGDLVCRWNLQPGQGYAQARDRWAPFDRLQAPDPATRNTLAQVIRATLDAGQHAWVTINNKAEGSGPLSVLALAQALGVR